jgi:hypothetical protein
VYTKNREDIFMTGISNDGCQKLIGVKSDHGLTRWEYKNECDNTTIFEASRGNTLVTKTTIDANGRTMEHSIYGEEEVSTKKTDYYPDGKVKEVNHHDTDGSLKYKEIHKYHENGKYDRIMYYNSNNEPTGIRLFDEDGIITYEEHVGDDGSKSEIIYDKENNLERIMEYKDGRLTKEVVNNFNPATMRVGTTLQETEYNEDGSKTETFYEPKPIDPNKCYGNEEWITGKKVYDEDGSMTETFYNEDGFMTGKNVYDKDGNLRRTDSQDNFFDVIQTYDENGKRNKFTDFFRNLFIAYM